MDEGYDEGIQHEGVAVGSMDGDGVGFAVGLLEGMDEGSVVGMEETVLVGKMG